MSNNRTLVRLHATFQPPSFETEATSSTYQLTASEYVAIQYLTVDFMEKLETVVTSFLCSAKSALK